MHHFFTERKVFIINCISIWNKSFNWTRNNKDTFLVIQAHTFFNKFKLVIFINFINDAAMINKAVLVNSKKCRVYLESYVLFLKSCQYQVNRNGIWMIRTSIVYINFSLPLLIDVIYIWYCIILIKKKQHNKYQDIMLDRIFTFLVR